MVIALVYLRGWIRLWRTSTIPLRFWRLTTFVGALFAVWIVAASPLATLDHRSLIIHMVKHLLLMTVAAPLMLFAKPEFPLLYGLPHPFPRIDLRAQPAEWVHLHLQNRTFCWLAGMIAVIAWHIPAAFKLALRFHWAHGLENLSFLFAGLLFWWPVVKALRSAANSPKWSMVMYLFLATIPCDILSAFLAFCNRVVYTGYLSATQLFGLSPLDDQQCAGALMWVWITFAYTVPAVILAIQVLAPRAQSPKTLGPLCRLEPVRLSGSEGQGL